MKPTRQMQREWGVTQEDTVGKTDLTIPVPPDDRPGWRLVSASVTGHPGYEKTTFSWERDLTEVNCWEDND